MYLAIDLISFFQGILQALEYLLKKGYAPRRGFYIGLGHDEEVLQLFRKLYMQIGFKTLYLNV